MTFEKVKEHPEDERLYISPKPKYVMLKQVDDLSVSDEDVCEVKKILFKVLE